MDWDPIRLRSVAGSNVVSNDESGPVADFLADLAAHHRPNSRVVVGSRLADFLTTDREVETGVDCYLSATRNTSVRARNVFEDGEQHTIRRLWTRAPDGSPRRRLRGPSERGAAMVELVLVIPVFLMLIFGAITAGLAYEHKAEVVHAVRDGARYGATVPLDQCNTTSNCGGRNWAQLVQYVTAQRSDGTLSTAQICVALVSGTGAVYSHTGGVYSTGTNSTFPTTGCFDDGNADQGARVHVSAVRNGDKINLVLGSIPVTLGSHGSARYEQPQ